MRKKQLIINLISNSIAFGTSLLISFILTPYLISTIGKEGYSFYPLANNFVSYMTIITLALNSMAARFITIEVVKKNITKAKTYYSSIFFANAILVVVLFIPMVVIIAYLDSFLSMPSALISEVKLLFILIFISMLISVISSVFGVATFVENRLDLRSGGEIFQGLLRLLLYIFLFSQFKPTIVFIGVVTLMLSVTNLVLQVVFTKKLLPDFKISFQRFDIHAVKELLSSGIWNSINSAGSILLLSTSLLLANLFLGVSAAGKLSIVQILPQFISSIITMLFAVFIPRITHVYAMGDNNAIVREITFSQKIIGLFSSTPIILIIVFGQQFFSLWVPTENAVDLQLLSLITILPLTIHGNMWTVYGANVVLNKLRLPSLVLIGVGGVHIIVCFVLLKYIVVNIYVIPIVSATLNISYYLLFIPMYAASQLKVSKLTFYPHLLKAIIFLLTYFLIGSIMMGYLTISRWWDLLLIGGVFGLIGIVVNSLFVLSKSDIKHIHAILTSLRNRIRKNTVIMGEGNGQ